MNLGKALLPSLHYTNVFYYISKQLLIYMYFNFTHIFVKNILAARFDLYSFDCPENKVSSHWPIWIARYGFKEVWMYYISETSILSCIWLFIYWSPSKFFNGKKWFLVHSLPSARLPFYRNPGTSLIIYCSQTLVAFLISYKVRELFRLHLSKLSYHDLVH